MLEKSRSIGLRQRRGIKDVGPKHKYKIDLWGEESRGEEDSQGETLARRIHLREE